MRTGIMLRPDAAATARRPRRRLSRNERGGAVAIESVLLVPAVMLMAALIAAGFRITAAADVVENVAGAGARAASIARTAGQAQQDAQSVANSSLATAGLQCAPSSVQVNTAAFAVPVGQPASVTVTVSCRAPLADLLVPGLGGSRLLEATSSSPLDTYRSRR
jgi:Flp pilus assembly protein TadG